MILFKLHQDMVEITYQILHGQILDFHISVSNGNMKCPIGKSIFAVNLPLQLFPAPIANANTRSLKSHHTLLIHLLTGEI